MWNEMARLSREMDRLFGETATGARAGVFPPLNLYDNGEALVVRAEIPGLKTEDLEVHATVNSLTVKGTRKATEVQGASYHRRERGHGVFSRTIGLPQEVDPQKVKAAYRNGVLEVTLPRAEATKPRKIQIGS
jgi:HSP20 family protein